MVLIGYNAREYSTDIHEFTKFDKIFYEIDKNKFTKEFLIKNL